MSSPMNSIPKGMSFLLTIAILAWVLPAQGQTGRGVQTFVPSESQLKLESAMQILRESSTIQMGAVKAEALMREAISLDPNQKRAYYNLIVLLLKTDRQAEAKSVLDEALKNNPDFGDAIALTAYMQDQSSRGETDAYFQEAISQDSMSSVANNHMAKVALEKKDWQSAVLHSRKALVGNPESINAYLNMAIAYYEQRQYDLAILVARSGLRHDSDNANLLNLEGLILLKKDDVKEALSRFSRAVTAEPGNLEAQLNAGALTLNYNDFESSLKHFDAASQIDPSHMEALLSKGVALRGLERFTEAEAVFKEGLKRFPNESQPQYNLCILYHEHMNQYETALVECQKYANQLSGEHPKKEEMVKRIEGIQSTIEALKE